MRPKVPTEHAELYVTELYPIGVQLFLLPGHELTLYLFRKNVPPTFSVNLRGVFPL